MSRVLLWVQHLLGIGHLRRAALLAEAMAARGLDVTIATGGLPVAGLRIGRARLVQLPPARVADGSFQPILDERGLPIDDKWREGRREALLELHRDLRPDVLMTELFPFGRRAFRYELLPLLAAARAGRAPPLVVASVRDILVAAGKPGRDREMVETFTGHYDRLLVHGDPAIARLEASFPLAAELSGRTFYTGYVADIAPPTGAQGRGEVIVSAGGGAVGAALLQAALAARPLSEAAHLTWRLLVGTAAPAGLAADLAAKAGPGIVVEPARDDFTTLLANAALSVSQAGYNTLMEVVARRTPAVVVPFAAAGQTEQGLRARLLAARGMVQVVDEATLTPAGLAAAIDRALAAPKPAFAPRLDGAASTAELVAGWTAARS